ncbi:MAG: amino acid adenylation domain-containing protein [Solirubrobacterales bacterium]|nr:amino acid adenylation domain-containing protein [Solirubrobacterales bacterium]
MQETKTEAVGFRLSPQQEQLLVSVGTTQATQCAVLLDGPVDLDRLRGALADATARHEILRTTFVQPAGMRMPQQVIATESSSAWLLEEEPSAAGLTGGGEELRKLLAREAKREFDLQSGPLVRVLVAGAAEESALLVLSSCAACADASSLLLLLGELCASYGVSELSEEPVQYADYAEWRHELIADEESAVQDGLAFWREAGADRPSAPRVLFALRDQPSSGQRAFAALDLREIDLAQLQRGAVAAGVTVAAFLEASWHALVAHMSGASELVLAGWSEGRMQPDLDRTIGPYEQPTPIHSRFQETTTFAEILDQVRRSRALAERWQDCGDGTDLTALAGQAAAGWSFHTVGPLSAPARAILALRIAPAGAPLLLALRAGELGLAGELSYDPVAVSAEDANELAERFVTVLHSALADPSTPAGQLLPIDSQERDRLLSASSAPASSAPQTSVHERFGEQAKLTPERPAVIGAAQTLSYAELDAAANRLANHLQQLGSQSEHPVGLCMERTPAMLVALLAILKTGSAYVPLNHEHPAARLSHQLRDTGARMLVTEDHLLADLPELGQIAVCVDRDSEAIAGNASTSPGCQVASEDLAYVMYTSGSTGTPKGVAVTHANLAGYASSIAARLFSDEDPAGVVFGVASAISTDLGNTSIFTPLVSGGTIRLIGAEAAMDGELLAAELQGAPLDVLKIAPSHLRALIASNAPGVLPRRWLVLGGEALSWELVEQVRAQAPGCRILNHYGPTETTVGCTTYLVDDQCRPDSLTVPIGFPLVGARAHVLDRRLEPVPIGVPGELCIAGGGVARGYLAAEAGGPFTSDPFAEESDARMYRTGDRVRRLRDGAIEFLGRLDDQVKIRGYRIEPGEIEASLLSHAAIHQVAVCAEDDERGGLRLAAYMVAPEPPAVKELRAFLGERLPEHMIPSAFRTVEALPLSASGKIDRRALAGIAEVQARREAEYVAPRDEVEQQIAEIWGEMLGVARVGALDDFFALGGHSLLATQATMRIRRLYGEIPLRALLAAPTVAALAEVIRATGTPGAGDGGQ